MKFLTLAFLSLAIFARSDDMTDFDGDGLPDVWETAFGLRTNSAVGVDGPYGDPDCDGLNNLAEYRAGYYNIGGNIYSNAANAIAGLCPTNGHSVNAAIWDAYLRPAGTNACLRWLYNDHDFVDDSWESTNSVAGIDTIDNDTDVGGGVSAWSANRMASMRRTAPTIKASIYYRGVHKALSAPIVLHFYSAPEMNSQPDAIATIANTGIWSSPLIVTVTNFVYGYVHCGTNYVFAFLDANNGGTWDAGEPCGVASPFATVIGWDYNRLSVQLTDYTPGYLRMDLTGKRSEDVISGGGAASGGGGSGSGSAALETRVRVLRYSADGYPYQEVLLDKVIESPRTYLHEGDFMAPHLWTAEGIMTSGVLGLDWGLVDVPSPQNREQFVYKVYVGNADVLTNNTCISVFTNKFDVGADERAQAVATSPIKGKYVYSARPTFKWSMPDGYIAFAIEIKKGSSSGTTIYQSGALQEPVRDQVTGEYVWQAPICAGDTLPNGQVFASNALYAWRVIALNSKFTLDTTPIKWSSWNTFIMQVPAANRPASYGKIGCVVGYAGTSDNRNVAVEAFDDAGFAGYPSARCMFDGGSSLTNLSISAPNATLIGLSPSTYYTRAYIDANTNGFLDAGESWGYANRFGESSVFPFDPKPVSIKSAGPAPTATIIIEDP